MPLQLLVFYGSNRADRAGYRFARYLTVRLAGRGHDATLIDAREVGLPMLDRMYNEYLKGEAPENMERPAAQLRRLSLRHRHRRVQLERPAWPEEPDRPLPRGMILASGRHRELLGRARRRCPRQPRLARDPVGNGHRGRAEYVGDRPDRPPCGKDRLVTGASSGIGHATALRLSVAGARVLASGRNPNRLGALVLKLDHQAEALTADLARTDEIERMIAGVYSPGDLKSASGDPLEIARVA